MTKNSNVTAQNVEGGSESSQDISSEDPGTPKL